LLGNQSIELLICNLV